MRSVRSARGIPLFFRLPLLMEQLEDRAVPGFLAPRLLDAGSFPFSVAGVDVNNDNIVDLAVANHGGDVSVLLGNGDGTFQAARHFLAGTLSRSVAAGDVNGDGWLDLAVANNGSHDVSVLLGNGDGTFQAARNFDAGVDPTSVAVGEFNGDGRLDLAVANYSSNDVSILLGNGDGTFRLARNFAAGNGQPYSVAVGEFNGDGRLDLAVANGRFSDYSSGFASVLLGNGDGTFQAPRYFAAEGDHRSVVVGEFSGDGRLDLALVSQPVFVYSGGARVLLGNGDGTFQAAQSYAAGGLPTSVAIGDFNGDCRLDLTVTNNISLNVSVFLGSGHGQFQPQQQFATGGRPRSVAVGDFNRDGWLDAVTGNLALADNVSVLLNDRLWTPDPGLVPQPCGDPGEVPPPGGDAPPRGGDGDSTGAGLGVFPPQSATLEFRRWKTAPAVTEPDTPQSAFVAAVPFVETARPFEPVEDPLLSLGLTRPKSSALALLDDVLAELEIPRT